MRQYNITDTKHFPNPASIKRPIYLPPITTREEKEQWDAEIRGRLATLTTDYFLPNRKIKKSPYNLAIGGCNQKSIPKEPWLEIVEHCLYCAVFTWDRDKIANVIKYNETAEKKLRVPKSVCPLPNYFWKLLHFTSCTWIKKYGDELSMVPLDNNYWSE